MIGKRFFHHPELGNRGLIEAGRSGRELDFPFVSMTTARRQSMPMKKFINAPENLTVELLEGFALAFSHKITLQGKTVLRAVPKSRDKVALVTLGGAGHEPALSGFVGPGMLDASVVGDIFAAPGSPRRAGGPPGHGARRRNAAGDPEPRGRCDGRQHGLRDGHPAGPQGPEGAHARGHLGGQRRPAGEPPRPGRLHPAVQDRRRGGRGRARAWRKSSRSPNGSTRTCGRWPWP